MSVTWSSGRPDRRVPQGDRHPSIVPELGAVNRAAADVARNPAPDSYDRLEAAVDALVRWHGAMAGKPGGGGGAYDW